MDIFGRCLVLHSWIMIWAWMIYEKNKGNGHSWLTSFISRGSVSTAEFWLSATGLSFSERGSGGM